ncbi:hypothetical protein BO71DRAFT_400910 [Aspergillus ellipticus CBS 707.79]|uniref:Uncharacterized protein n=1 Tax=Aspergillus ellipticus CBS 707.79 TaxID=1448320 RepID=A0A319DV44_9EURO|nr:hypothetical protein BO71DRAFT_400910 [Aspergillus ellipticus CBS 707.79]
MDAIILFEACCTGLLPRVKPRLSEEEQLSIRHGSVYVWDEQELDPETWVDGRDWKFSETQNRLKIFHEKSKTRMKDASTDDSMATQSAETEDKLINSTGKELACQYKSDRWKKRCFEATVSTGQHLHLVSYLNSSIPLSINFPTPSRDPDLQHINLRDYLYPVSIHGNEESLAGIARDSAYKAPQT